MAERTSGETAKECSNESSIGHEIPEKSKKVSVEEKLEEKQVHLVSTNPECVVCLQPCHHPVQLPCNHIFCFLCVKGVAARSRKCALCRADVPESYFENPIVVEVHGVEENASADVAPAKEDTVRSYKWFYEGRNGWWLYEDRASDQIEEAFSEGKQAIEILIAGFAYVIDIENMVQYRKNYPTRRRRIKRDKKQADKKGVAGLKYNKECQSGSVAAEEADDQKRGVPTQQTKTGDFENEVQHVSEKLEKAL